MSNYTLAQWGSSQHWKSNSIEIKEIRVFCYVWRQKIKIWNDSKHSEDIYKQQINMLPLITWLFDWF